MLFATEAQRHSTDKINVALVEELHSNNLFIVDIGAVVKL